MALPVGTPRDIARRWLGGYLAASTGLFAVGTAVGWVLIADVPPEALAALGSGPSPFPTRITVRTILVNNLVALAVVLAGVVTFALTTVVSLLFNGLLIGLILGAAAGPSLAVAVALVLPHGVFELPAFWIAGAVSFRVTHRLIRYLRGQDDVVLTRPERYEAVLLAIVAVALIVVAAVIEATLTVEVAEWATGRAIDVS